MFTERPLVCAKAPRNNLPLAIGSTWTWAARLAGMGEAGGGDGQGRGGGGGAVAH
jgi:hypothetical protein